MRPWASCQWFAEGPGTKSKALFSNRVQVSWEESAQRSRRNRNQPTWNHWKGSNGHLPALPRFHPGDGGGFSIQVAALLKNSGFVFTEEQPRVRSITHICLSIKKSWDCSGTQCCIVCILFLPSASGADMSWEARAATSRPITVSSTPHGDDLCGSQSLCKTRGIDDKKCPLWYCRGELMTKEVRRSIRKDDWPSEKWPEFGFRVLWVIRRCFPASQEIMEQLSVRTSALE